jgi:hypothetical protein
MDSLLETQEKKENLINYELFDNEIEEDKSLTLTNVQLRELIKDNHQYEFVSTDVYHTEDNYSYTSTIKENFNIAQRNWQVLLERGREQFYIYYYSYIYPLMNS